MERLEQSVHIAPRFPRLRPTRALMALCAVLAVTTVISVGLLLTRPMVEAESAGCVYVTTGEGR